MSDHKLIFNSLPWTETAPGAREKAFVTGGKRLRLLELTGEFQEASWCNRAHFGYVMNGVLEIAFEKKKVVVGVAEGLAIPGGEAFKHKVRAVTPTVQIFLVEDAA
ncbi:MAG: hypothetical protein MUC55_10755 [Burkholderiales bacterium]|jgi:hypothetical protein|nr:hypothetical protein [Burkholderiales bacterium]